MEVQKISYQETLMAELAVWNKQEKDFISVFGGDVIKDRKYQQMKLQEYDRIFRYYAGRLNTTDERGLFRMLKFQRHRLERALYPRLSIRLFRRVLRLLRPALIFKNELEQVLRDGKVDPYASVKLPADSGFDGRSKSDDQKHQYQPPDLGPRKEQEQKNGLHL